MAPIAAAVASLLLFGLWVPGVAAALPTATITMSLAKNPPDYDAPITVTIKIKLSAPTSSVSFRVEGSGLNADTCQPAAYCLLYFGVPQWMNVPATTGSVTASFEQASPPYGATFTFYADSGMSQNGSVQLVVRFPTTTTKLAVTAPGVVMPGTNLHVKATATGNAKEYSTLSVRFPTGGFGTPFNLSAGAAWNGTEVREDLVLDPTAGFTFDVPVTAGVGTKLRIEADWLLLYVPEKSSYTFTVGAPLPTPTPKPTPKPTVRPSPKATGTAPPSIPPSAEASASPSTEPTEASASLAPGSEGPPSVVPETLRSVASPTSGPDASPTGSSGGSIGPVIVAMLLAAAAGVGLAWWRRPRPG